jgi:hypothetical protein
MHLGRLGHHLCDAYVAKHTFCKKGTPPRPHLRRTSGTPLPHLCPTSGLTDRSREWGRGCRSIRSRDGVGWWVGGWVGRWVDWWMGGCVGGTARSRKFRAPRGSGRNQDSQHWLHSSCLRLKSFHNIQISCFFVVLSSFASPAQPSTARPSPAQPSPPLGLGWHGYPGVQRPTATAPRHHAAVWHCGAARHQGAASGGSATRHVAAAQCRSPILHVSGVEKPVPSERGFSGRAGGAPPDPAAGFACFWRGVRGGRLWSSSVSLCDTQEL